MTYTDEQLELPYANLTPRSNICLSQTLMQTFMRGMGTGTSHIYNKYFRPLWSNHFYVLFNCYLQHLIINCSLRYSSATYYFQWNPLLSPLLNDKTKRNVEQVKKIFSNGIRNSFYQLVFLERGNICWTTTYDQYN